MIPEQKQKGLLFYEINQDYQALYSIYNNYFLPPRAYLGKEVLERWPGKLSRYRNG